MKALEFKNLAFEVKDVGDQGTFSGYASTFNNVDLDGDRILPGAFKRTLDHNKGIVPILWQHRYDEPIGKNLVAREDEHGLYVEGMLDLNVQKGKEAYSLLKNGIIQGLSIGFRPISADPGTDGARRNIKEIALAEYSVVTFPANPEAGVDDVKGVTGFKDFPLADKNRPWKAGTAVKHCRTWAGGPDADKIDWKKYGECFMYSEEGAKEFGAFHLPYVDIIGGKPYAVPHALHAVESRLNSTQIPADAKKTILAHVQRYLKRLEKPGDKPDTQKGVNMEKAYSQFEYKALDFVEAFHHAQTEKELYKQRWAVDDAKNDAIASVYGDNSLSNDQKGEMCKNIYKQYGDAMTEWHKAHINHVFPNGNNNDGDTDDKGKSFDYLKDMEQKSIEEVKAGRKISAATKKTLQNVMAKHQKAMDMHKDVMSMHQNAIDDAKAMIDASEVVDDTYDSPDGIKPVQMKEEEKSFLDDFFAKFKS